MAVFLGEAGCVEIKRTSLDEVIAGTVVPSDVNPDKDRFSFDFRLGSLLTGDQVEIKTTDGRPLDFISPNGWYRPGSAVDLPLPAFGPFVDYANARVIFYDPDLVGSYQSAEVVSHLGNSLEDDWPNGFTSPEFDAGTADYDNADIQPRNDLGFLTPYRDGIFYLFVDEVGAIRLYRTFDEAMSGEIAGRVDLIDPGRAVPIQMTVRNNNERILGQVRSFEINTSRDALDVSALSDEFRKQYSGLISGSGRIDCFFDYERRLCDPMTTGVSSQVLELPVYITQLIMRTKVGSEFWAKLTLVGRGLKPGGRAEDVDDEIWYEFDALITEVGLDFSPTEAVEVRIEYVTTGEVKLRTRYASNFILQEQGFGARIRQEINQSGFLEVQQQD